LLCGDEHGWVHRKTPLFFEFSLCLSRAWLGKMFVFIYKWRKKRRFWVHMEQVMTPCADPSLTFDGPVVVLISGYTLSAAEVFTLMMQAHPHVTFVGST
jgi:hypothetical protein